ncbi:hypothetical protein ACFQ8C_29390 [Streptomyces sp. NPDC056503]|uniref:hypothetical protein n=1 Tax=Streptomyces sp. NPDC056503 TaxID=3345842 RepID=UPI0036AED67C
MSFEDEWAAAKSAASGRAGMRLNQAPTDPGNGGPSADLAVREDHLGAIGHAAYALHGRLAKDGNHARMDSHEAVTALSAHHFRTGAALATVQETWGFQLRTLLHAVAHISNHLDYSVASHAKDDAEIGTSLTVSKIDEYFK